MKENCLVKPRLHFAPVTFGETLAMPGWCLNFVVVFHKDEDKLADLILSYRHGTLFEALIPQPKTNAHWIKGMEETMIAVVNDDYDPGPCGRDDGLYCARLHFSTLCLPPVRFLEALTQNGFAVGAFTFARHFERFYYWVNGKSAVYELEQVPQRIDVFDVKGYRALLKKTKKQFGGDDLQPFWAQKREPPP